MGYQLTIRKNNYNLNREELFVEVFFFGVGRGNFLGKITEKFMRRECVERPVKDLYLEKDRMKNMTKESCNTVFTNFLSSFYICNIHKENEIGMKVYWMLHKEHRQWVGRVFGKIGRGLVR